MTLHESISEYLVKKKNLKPYSYQSTRQRAERIMSLIGDVDLKDLDTEAISGYVDDWCNKYSKSTISSYLTIIKEVLRNNGCSIDKICINKNKSSKIKLYNRDEIKQFEFYFQTHKIKYNHLPIVIAMYTGMRLGEICALQWLNVDLDRKLISVSKNVVQLIGEGRLIQQPKTLSSIREIAIPYQLYEILIKFRPKNNKDWDLFICNNKDYPPLARSCQRTAQTIAQHIGVNWKGFHAFRHSYATKMIESGIQPKVVSDLLGHSNVSTTLNIYTHTTNDFKKDCVDRVFIDENYEKEETKSSLYQQVLDIRQQIDRLLLKLSNIQGEQRGAEETDKT